MNASSPVSRQRLAASLQSRLARAVFFGAALAGLALVSAQAQTSTSAVPGLFNFQGKVANANGTLVGAGTPVNRTVIFRIWDHSSASTSANLVYSEQQVVTITDGEFSVLIGQGSAVSGTPLGYNEAAKGPPTVTIATASVFGGATRYLGVTIDDGNPATTDPEVTPRQQLVTSAYAFRAKYAESVGSNGVNVLTVLDSGNVGIGSANPAAKLDVNGAVALNSGFGNTGARPVVGTSRIGGEVSGYSSSGAFSDDGFLRLSAGGGTSANAKSFIDLSGFSNVADMDRNLVFGTAGVERMRINNSGALLLKGGLINSSSRPAVGASRIAAEIGGYSSSGAGYDDGFLRLSAGGGTTANTKTFIDLSGYSTVADMNLNLVFGTGSMERMRIDSSGNVGIGTTTAGVATGSFNKGKLSVDGNIALRGDGTGAHSWINQRLLFGGDATGYLLQFASVNNAGTLNPTIMALSDLGRVGIGTTGPAAPLHVKGAGTSGSVTAQFDWSGTGNNSHIHYGSTGDIYWRSGLSTGKVILQDSGGRVGIGTASPAVPLHVANWAPVDTYEEARGDAFGFSDTANAFRSQMALGAIIDSTLRAATFIVNSDARIKNLQGRSDGPADLATLLQIEITNYTYRDKQTNGGKMHKKVIAQQVEQVFPQAVNQGTGVLPDIRVKAPIEDGWIVADTDLKVGERVRLIGSEGSSVCEVREVQPGRFRAAFESKTNQVFVYGREVSDFRSVDYEAISMLNVSATQELKREKDAEIAELKKRVAELEAKDRARDAKLASIEKLLQANQTVMASPAKTTSNNGQE